MATITTPLDKDLEEFINRELKEGRAESKAHVVRSALRLLREERALAEIREAEADIRAGCLIRGDLREIVKKFPD